MNHECSQWHLEWWILSKRFSIDFAQILRGLNLLWQLKPYNIYSLKNETWKSKLLLDPWTSVIIVLAGMMTTLISLSISIRALGRPGTLSMSSNILKGIFFFFWSVSLNSRLKIFSKSCTQMCCHPGFVVPLVDHKHSRFSIILKGFKILEMLNDHWLQLNVTSCISP